MRLTILGLTLFLAAAAAFPQGGRMSFQISSAAFQHEQDIPPKYTCKGPDLSPALAWSGPPAGTRSFVLIVDDPDAPAGTWVHWLAYNIPPTVAQFAEGMPKDAQLKDGTRQGSNDFGKIGYNGPCPPPGGPHRYFFRLYALNTTLDLKPGAKRKELDAAIAGKVLAQTELMGKFKR